MKKNENINNQMLTSPSNKITVGKSVTGISPDQNVVNSVGRILSDMEIVLINLINKGDFDQVVDFLKMKNKEGKNNHMFGKDTFITCLDNILRENKHLFLDFLNCINLFKELDNDVIMNIIKISEGAAEGYKEYWKKTLASHILQHLHSFVNPDVRYLLEITDFANESLRIKSHRTYSSGETNAIEAIRNIWRNLEDYRDIFNQYCIETVGYELDIKDLQ